MPGAHARTSARSRPAPTTLRAWTITCRSPSGSSGAPSPSRSRGAPTAPTGTATPTSTRPRTAPSSATPASSGVPRATPRTSCAILGDVAGLDVLEVGSGAGQCSRWVRTHGGRGFGLDLSHRQLQHSLRLDEETGVAVPSVRGTATAPALRARRASTSSSAPSARCSSSATSTTRSPRSPACCAPAAASPSRSPTRPAGCSPTTRATPGLTATQSYWDRTPYVEIDDATGVVSYVEHHRTLGDWVRLLAGARLHAGRPRRARVARAPRPGVGRLVTRPRAADARARRSSSRTWLALTPGASGGAPSRRAATRG